MEDMLEVFFVIIFAGIGLISKYKAKEKRRGSGAAHQLSSAKQTPAAKPAQPYAPIQPTVMPAMSFGDVPGQAIPPVTPPAIQPTVHPHLQPDCDTHDQPGSLGVTSTEGKDPCHEEQLTYERTSEAYIQEEGGLTFDWSGQSMVKAFVMQEVLARPVSRRSAR